MLPGDESNLQMFVKLPVRESTPQGYGVGALFGRMVEALCAPVARPTPLSVFLFPRSCFRFRGHAKAEFASLMLLTRYPSGMLFTIPWGRLSAGVLSVPQGLGIPVKPAA